MIRENSRFAFLTPLRELREANCTMPTPKAPANCPVAGGAFHMQRQSRTVHAAHCIHPCVTQRATSKLLLALSTATDDAIQR